MTTIITSPMPGKLPSTAGGLPESECGCLRESLGNRFVYALVSSRARGLSVGVNMNPDKFCNFDCEYCEVDRNPKQPRTTLDLDMMTDELKRVLELAHSGELNNFDCFRDTPKNFMELRHVALSGDGEPTLSPDFLDIVRAVVHVRALGRFPFFKIVLITNATGLDLKNVQDGLKLFMPQDEVWAKLDAGSQKYLEALNHPDCLLEKILENILLVARQRPVIIQSLFPMLNQAEPPAEEIERYAERLNDLKRAGAQIPLVQIYSANRPAAHSQCEHLPLKTLAHIARRVREVTGLKAEVF